MGQHIQVKALVRILGGLAAILLAFVAGRISTAFPQSPKQDSNPRQEEYDSELNEANEHYTFVSPLLECEAPEYQAPAPLVKLQDRVDQIVEKAQANGDIEIGAVYFRDLDSGPWFGVNEEEPFMPASLLKVPLLMTYLEQAESDPDVLNETIPFDGGVSQPTQNFVYAEPLKPGSYSVRNLLERMMQTSDNTAMGLLTDDRLISLERIKEIYTDFSMHSPTDEPEYEMDVETYASFFRALYGATYISRDMSEYALRLLSDSEFPDGIRAGIPTDVMVAHKFGERLNTSTGERQLHDCGIVYAPGEPYLLCVMTRGDDFKDLASVIARISKEVYAHVSD